VHGAGLDTAVSSQSGTILGNNYVNLAMSPYSFFPDILQRRWLGQVDLKVRYDMIFPPNADTPRMQLYNPPGGGAPYLAEWRHVIP
jgi:hypothetical protein